MDQPSKILLNFNLMKKKEWQPDSEYKECKECSSTFNCFFRRKHHCRLCGEIFCSRYFK
jgi:1-phosphatidylinositol-3-phosphate 5-kinase